ncbi:MAG: N-acetylmuramoyl-L-alanine amidase [Thermodesulfobacteriota bacterium]
MNFLLHNRRTLRLLSLLAFLLAWAAPVTASAGSKVDEIRHWSNPSYTRVVISLDKEASFDYRLLKKDPSISVPWRRLYIDIHGTRITSGLQRSIPINDGLLKKARVGQYKRDTVRVVLDIESIKDYKIFPLSNPYRIVIDVSGEPGSKRAARPAARPPALSSTPSLTQQLGLKVRRIVVDAGHGGKDPGAIGRGGLKEKDVTLRLAKMLASELRDKLDAEVILTRNRDVFIPLEERTAIANSKDADLFVSIHINASPRRAASGIETYILNISNDEEAIRVAARENSTSRRSVSDLEFILNDLIKTAKTNDSARLAESVQVKLVTNLKRKYRNVRGNGVKGAPFYVLVGTKMPAILVEVSFISNPREEKRLRDKKYLREVVKGIRTGLEHYINGPGSV